MKLQLEYEHQIKTAYKWKHGTSMIEWSLESNQVPWE